MEPAGQTDLRPATPEMADFPPFPAPMLLIVDDQPLLAEYMAAVAKEAGWAVDLACSASEFEDKFQSGQPDMIALDLAMPVRDGIELLRYLSANDYLGNLIIISGCDEPVLEASAMLAREHGLALTGYLQKPVTAESFASLLSQAVAMVAGLADDRSRQ